MLTTEQRQTFDKQGYVRIPGVFSKTEAVAMEERIWTTLGEKYGIRRTEPTTWPVTYVTGLQKLRTHTVFKPIGGTVICEAIDAILGAGRWNPPKHWGQFLITFPEPERAWAVPSHWHTDFGFMNPPDSTIGVMVFSFLADVAPRGGGTAVLAGSHHLMRRFVETQPRETLEKMKRARKAFLRSDPWLADLASNGDDPAQVERFMETQHTVDDIPVRVCELTGEAGDIIIGHPWLLHSPAHNCSDHPRFMRIQRIRPIGGC